ncbi:MAG: hypothetical protein Q8K96_04690 [Rubrivivax sp.]|nr:hypothetical protein [Rubrivivax sp.]
MNKKRKTSRKTLRPVGSAAVIGEAPAAGDAVMPIVDRPDGYYWQAPDGRQQFGPFETYEAARVDRDRFDEQRPVPGETLQEAESEVGVADWIDAETGEPAEGQSPPHLEEN